ncbi:MAG: hypothetical protein OEU92_20425 [Alphaproteobacteria bacterium]|nr:hypothetical protein [Alphaproteobacteria bacterium]
MRAIALTLLFGFVAGTLMIEAYLRFDDYSALAVDYAYHEWDGRERRVMATAEDLADPRKAIVVLGDSMVAGINCGREQNLVGHFAHAMQPIAEGYKAINLGSANTSVFAYLDQLQGYAAGEGPPRGVIVMLYTNDADVIEPRMCPVADVIARAEGLSPSEKADIQDFCKDVVVGQPGSAEAKPWFAIGGPVDSWLHGFSYAYRFFRETFALLAVKLDGGEPIGRLRYPSLWSSPESLEFRLIAAGMQEIKALADRHDIPMMVAFFPPIEFLSKDNPMYEANEIAGRELEDRLGLPVLNGFDAYLGDARASRNMSRSLTDHHPSCAAHQILAEWLVQKFEEAGGFEESPSSVDPAKLAQPASG